MKRYVRLNKNVPKWAYDHIAHETKTNLPKKTKNKKNHFWLIKHLEVCKALDLLANSIQILINYKWQNWHIKSENGRCQLEDHRVSLFIDTFGCKEFEQKPSPWCHIKFQGWCDWRKHVFCWICRLDCHLLLLFLRWDKLWTRHYQN